MPTYTFKERNIFKSAVVSSEDGSVAYDIHPDKGNKGSITIRTRKAGVDTTIAEIHIKTKECIVGGRVMEIRKEAPEIPFEFTASDGTTYKWTGAATDFSTLVTKEGQHPAASFDKRSSRATLEVYPEVAGITDEILASIIYVKSFLHGGKDAAGTGYGPAMAISSLGDVLQHALSAIN
ncbi:hypothetical protein Moror_10391 [Moniliophthora roreri MCA 2997]|uniref:DUF6593 domain-containing protein n=1 Tax=Moniliophthora roreri (strain MCA 2997) TaxID=1381753 RepID=V2XHG9_MONRO|nr:hypothetical protein Moror_10391 [Moniliophthora roreri MCA 2997]